MFNPDRLIREVAAWALYEINVNEYHRNVNRIGETEKRLLNDVIVTTQRLSEFAEILFFQRIDMLKDIPGITLSYLADISDEMRISEGESIILDDMVNNDFIIVAKGKLDLYQKGEFVGEFSRGQFIGEMLGKQNFVNTNLILAKSEVSVLKFNKDKFYELLSDNVKLANKVLEFA
jgi:CRP-like cAMP-binding protein